jgi:DNA-directed RNA polymerase specialized sigma24 family protein
MPAGNHDGRTDVQLLRAARSDADAFSVFFRRHAPRIERWLAHQVGDREVALDLTAETFARALEGVGRFRALAGESGAPWRFGIAANQLSG